MPAISQPGHNFLGNPSLHSHGNCGRGLVGIRIRVERKPWSRDSLLDGHVKIEHIQYSLELSLADRLAARSAQRQHEFSVS